MATTDSTPLISIIVPIYNVEKYLDECVHSLLNQTYTHLEIILVDDGSTDTSGFIADHFSASDSRVVVIHQPNKGLSGARNTGILRATGDYLMFIDSDDYLATNTCEVLISNLQISNSDILMFSRCRFDGLGFQKNDIYPSHQYPLGIDYLHDNMHKNLSASSCNKIFKASLIRDNQFFFPEGLLYEDMLFCFKCFAVAQQVQVLSDIFYFYRVNRNGSIVNTIKEKDIDVLTNIQLLNTFLSENHIQLDQEKYNAFIYKWVCSAVLFKYPCIAPTNSQAKHIVKTIMQDPRFLPCIHSIQHSTVLSLPWRLSAYLMEKQYGVFSICIYLINWLIHL